MATPERDHSLTLTRRRFVQGVAAVGIAAAVEGKFNHADAEVIDHSPSVLTGNHFDLAIEPHHANFTGRRAKAIKIYARRGSNSFNRPGLANVCKPRICKFSTQNISPFVRADPPLVTR
jgi:hypothetical protein